MNLHKIIITVEDKEGDEGNISMTVKIDPEPIKGEPQSAATELAICGIEAMKKAIDSCRRPE